MNDRVGKRLYVGVKTKKSTNDQKHDARLKDIVNLVMTTECLLRHQSWKFIGFLSECQRLRVEDSVVEGFTVEDFARAIEPLAVGENIAIRVTYSTTCQYWPGTHRNNIHEAFHIEAALKSRTLRSWEIRTSRQFRTQQ